MKLILLFIIPISILSLFQCDRNVVVSVNDIQIDTLKLYKVAKQKVVSGRIMSWKDTTKALVAGKIRFGKPEGATVNERDTVMFLQLKNSVNMPRQKWIDHTAIQSLNKKIDFLEGMFTRVASLKKQVANKQRLSESDMEQLIFSLENTGISINTEIDKVEFDRIRYGIKDKIKRLHKEVQYLERKMRVNQVNSGPISIVSNCDGKLDILVEDGQEVMPGEPLFYVNSEIKESIVIKLDQIPSEELQYAMYLKIDKDLVNLSLDNLDESRRILHITENLEKEFENLKSSVNVSFESAPYKKLLINPSAIYQIDGKHFVFVKRNNGFESVRVKIGEKQGAMIEILNGLQPNDQIIVSSSKPIWHLSHLEIKQ